MASGCCLYYNLDIAQSIAHAITGVLAPFDEIYIDPESHEPRENRFFFKATGQGVAVNITVKEKMNITLSIAWKSLTTQPEFKFWSCLWNDSEQTLTRSLLEPFTDSISLRQFPLSIDQREAIVQDLQNKGDIYRLVVETVRLLIKTTLTVDQGYFKSHKRRIHLPGKWPH